MTTHHHDHDHHHGHRHGHSHGHNDAPANFDRAFAIGLVLNTGFVAVEAGFGIASNSLALLADAGHNLSDVAGLLLAWGAVWLGRRKPTARRTYGYGRATILAALANGGLLLIAIGAIGWESVRRLAAGPQAVEPGVVMWVAGAGIIVNAATALMFARGRQDDLNISGAYLHMAADAGVSAGVVVAGLVISLTNWMWLDPAVSLAIVAIIAAGTFGLVREAAAMAVDTVPRGINRDAVLAFLQGQPGVCAVHDLHIWPLSTTQTALTAHLVQTGSAIDDARTAAMVEGLRDWDRPRDLAVRDGRSGLRPGA